MHVVQLVWGFARAIMSLDHQNLPSFAGSNVRLEKHHIAREKACATTAFRTGATVLAVDALTVALLGGQKGQRCDFCLRAPLVDDRLLRCSGCAAFWYCGEACTDDQS